MESPFIFFCRAGLKDEKMLAGVGWGNPLAVEGPAGKRCKVYKGLFVKEAEGPTKATFTGGSRFQMSFVGFFFRFLTL